MNLQLNREETLYLKHALKHYLAELNGEIRGTDSQDFREDLKHEQEVLIVLNRKLDDEKRQ